MIKYTLERVVCMSDEIIKQIFKSTGNLSWLCILILLIFQFFYQYIFSKINQNMISISKNEYKYVKKRYEIYKALYFKLVKNIEDNSDINLSENEDARKYLQSFCKFNIKRYNDTFCYLSDDLLMCLYEYNSKKSNQSLKKIQRKIASEFDDIKKKMGLPYKGKALKYSTITMYSSFSLATVLMLISLLILCINSSLKNISFYFLIVGTLFGIVTIIAGKLNIYFLTKNKG